jgi:hypothetical protein
MRAYGLERTGKRSIHAHKGSLLHAFTGTTNPSDSLPAPRDFSQTATPANRRARVKGFVRAFLSIIVGLGLQFGRYRWVAIISTFHHGEKCRRWRRALIRRA